MTNEQIVPDLGDEDASLKAAVGLPAQLIGDPQRQAVPSISGTVYQAWRSIEGWLRLKDVDQVIYVEGAEDFDLVKAGSAVAVQVKRTDASISLGVEKVREALENFWGIVEKNPDTHVEFHYLTTADVVAERDADFGGLTGIDAWRVAQTNLDYAGEIRAYLVAKVGTSTGLGMFLTASTPEVVQDRLIKRFHWFAEQSDIEVIKRSIDDRIAVLLAASKRSTMHAERVRKYLESRYWEIVVLPGAAGRVLTVGELMRQVELATTTYLPIPLERLPEFIAATSPSHGLLALLLENAPQPPELLLRRSELTQRLEKVVEQRRGVILTGTVHKGKTTIAQVVATNLCPDAAWVSLTGRQPQQIDTLFLAIAVRLEKEEFPALLVVDDLDVSTSAQQAYRNSLALLILRLRNSGRSVIFTARGSANDATIAAEFRNIETIDIPELNTDEIRDLCIEYGCAPELASAWGGLVTIETAGHPKLVQIRIVELRSRSWPNPSVDDLTRPSMGVASIKQVARRMVSESLPGPVSEFVYTVAECSTLIDRTTAMRLAESIDGIVNAGDVVDGLVGKWLEQILGRWVRTTALLKGVGAEVWSEERRRLVHLRIFDAIDSKSPLSPAEAAALLFHAYFGKDARRVALTSMKLQLIDSGEAKREVERNLLWLPFAALGQGEKIVEEAMAAASLRSLQFRVALTLETDTLPQVCERWIDEVSRISRRDAKEVSSSLLWQAIGGSESLKVSIALRLRAIEAVNSFTGQSREMSLEGVKRVFLGMDPTEVPSVGTVSQLYLLLAAKNVRDSVSLLELVEWLDHRATADIRNEFDSMLEWPLIQGLGAFVQSAWSSSHESESEWRRWLPVFDRVIEIAGNRGMPRLGREAAKGKSIVLNEYLELTEESLAALDAAETKFGTDKVISAQRANVYYRSKDDQKVLAIWMEHSKDAKQGRESDPFAYRRAAVSAARLEKWAQAASIFIEGSSTSKSIALKTKFGFRVDAALALALGGDLGASAKLMLSAVTELPPEAKDEGDKQWEALQRSASEVCRVLDELLGRRGATEKRIEPGYASTPALAVPHSEPGQGARSEMLLISAVKLAANLTIEPEKTEAIVNDLSRSKYWVVRWYASEAALSMACSGHSKAPFVPALVRFIGELQALRGRDRSKSVVEPNEEDAPSAKALERPEQFWPLVVMVGSCIGSPLVSTLEKWTLEAGEVFGLQHPMMKIFADLLAGASLPANELYTSLTTLDKSDVVRSGAAMKYLLDPASPVQALRTQVFLVSVILSGGGTSFQPLYNVHVARRFAAVWREFAKNSFQFANPRTSVPQLLTCVESVEQGRGTLGALLVGAADATLQTLPDSVKAVA